MCITWRERTRLASYIVEERIAFFGSGELIGDYANSCGTHRSTRHMILVQGTEIRIDVVHTSVQVP